MVGSRSLIMLNEIYILIDCILLAQLFPTLAVHQNHLMNSENLAVPRPSGQRLCADRSGEGPKVSSWRKSDSAIEDHQNVTSLPKRVISYVRI